MRRFARQVVSQLQVQAENNPILDSFCSNLYYLTDNFGDRKAYSQLTELCSKLDNEGKTGGNRLFYLATPPSFFPVIVDHLGGAGLAKPVEPEKPKQPEQKPVEQQRRRPQKRETPMDRANAALRSRGIDR